MRPWCLGLPIVVGKYEDRENHGRDTLANFLLTSKKVQDRKKPGWKILDQKFSDWRKLRPMVSRPNSFWSTDIKIQCSTSEFVIPTYWEALKIMHGPRGIPHILKALGANFFIGTIH